MLKLILALIIFSLVMNVSQGALGPTAELPIITDPTPKIITSVEPTTVTEGVPITDITNTTDTQPPPIGTESGTDTTETTTETDTQPPPIGTDTTPTPTFRTTTPTYRTTTPTTTFHPTTTPPPICCGYNEFSHYTYGGVPEYCDPICNDLTKKCKRTNSLGAFKCYCLPRHCRDPNNICVLIRDAKKKCYLRK